MKKLILILLAALGFSSVALASGGGVAWDTFPQNKLNDVAALQNGAKLFANYCLSCHSASFMRYNRMRDIGLTDDQIKKNLMFATDKVGDNMRVSMDPKQAKEWFGATPPDLTLVARSRADGAKGSGADYLYTYLRTYYTDSSKATGWNNLAFPSVGMPNVLWELQGERQPIYEKVADPHNHGKHLEHFVGFEQIKPGTLTAAEFDNAVADLVAYMQWMGEPAQSQRVRLGVWVLIFLAFFTVIAWQLNAAYWKDVK